MKCLRAEQKQQNGRGGTAQKLASVFGMTPRDSHGHDTTVTTSQTGGEVRHAERVGYDIDDPEETDDPWAPVT
jgi:hypothetical protein